MNADLEHSQMLKREQAVVDRLVMDFGTPEQMREREKIRAFGALKDAEKRMFEYAYNLSVGDERTEAVALLEHIQKVLAKQ